MFRKIKHDLLPTQKMINQNLYVELNLYEHANELLKELDKIGLVQRLKDTAQLGAIKVTKELRRSRFDYTLLQLYLHQLVRCNLHTELTLTYNNVVRLSEFGNNAIAKLDIDKFTVGDIMQVLTIASNLGHFYNTFTASTAVTLLADEHTTFRDLLLKSSSDSRFYDAANQLLKFNNYYRLHLLNSLLALNRCNQNKDSVRLAIELLYAYLNEDGLHEQSKLHLVFNMFRKIRNVSYMAYDVQIANMPLLIDLSNEKSMIFLLRELLSIYNNQSTANNLIDSIGKMLDDSVYYLNSNVISSYRLSKKIAISASKSHDFVNQDYYSDFWLDPESVFNKQYSFEQDFDTDLILKLTFTPNENDVMRRLLAEADRIQNSRVGYYDRSTGESTIVMSIRKNCKDKKKTAARIMRSTIKHLRSLPSIYPSDPRYMLTVKFFLFYFFGEYPIVIKSTIHETICVLCTRGKVRRRLEIEHLLNGDIGQSFERHEASFMLDVLAQDDVNDTTISLPASILLFQKNTPGKNLCEFDGMIIHPFRSSNQIILLEAKDINKKPTTASKALKSKLDRLYFQFNRGDVQPFGYNAFLMLDM